MRAWIGIVAALVVLLQGRGATQTADESLSEFSLRMLQYVELHRRLEGPLPPLMMSDDGMAVRTAMLALAQQTRGARRTAHEGDVFTPQAARVVRVVIGNTLPYNQQRALIAEWRADTIPGAAALRINNPWPPGAANVRVPADLIERLPPLPAELQYRLHQRSLVLWDVHTDFVVDVLRDAFGTS